MDNITSRTIERLRFPMTVLVLFIHVLPFAASQGGIEYTFPFNTDSWSHRFIYFFNWIFLVWRSLCFVSYLAIYFFKD